MKTGKRFAALAAAVLLCLSVFAGCNGNGSSSTAASGTEDSKVSTTESSAKAEDSKGEESTASGEPVTLKMWHTWGEGPGLEALSEAAKRYNETNDKNVTVDVSFVASQSSGNTSTMDKLMASIAAGNPPQIAMLDNFQIATWAAQDALVGLDELMADTEMNMDDIYEWALAGSLYQGKTYSIPYNGDARALFYNKDLFEAAGLDPESPPATIDELMEMAKTLTQRDGSNYKQVGFVPWFKAGKPVYTWGWSFGGDFYDAETNTLTINNPKNIEALQWEVDFAKEMGGQDFVNYASSMGDGAEDPFISGQLAMVVRGQFDIANIAVYNPDLNYGIAPIPSKVAGENITWSGGWGFTIPRGATNQEASMDFLKFMLSQEAQETLVSTTSFSPVKSISEEMYKDDERMTVFMDMLPKSFVRPPVPVGQQLWDGLNTALDTALNGGDTAENLLNALNESMNAELQKFQ